MEAATQSKTLKWLCGKAREKKIDFWDEGLKDPDPILISFDVLFNAPIQTLFIGNNKLSDSGKSQLKAAWTQAGKSASDLHM